MSSRNVFPLIVILIASPPSLAVGKGRTSPPSDGSLEEVIVRPEDDRDLPSTGDPAASRVILDRNKIKAHPHSITQALEGSPGISVRHYGTSDDYAAVSIRGSRPEQVQVWLDHIPLATSSGLLLDIGQIAPSMIQDLLVSKGFALASSPFSAIGGSLHLQSHRIAREPTFSMGVGWGSFNTFVSEAGASFVRGDRVGLLASYRLSRTDGDFEYLDDRGTPLAPDDDRWVERKNNMSFSHSGFVKGSVSLSPESLVTLEDFIFQKKEGVPALGFNDVSQPRLETLRNHFGADLTRGFSNRRFRRMALSTFVSYERVQYADPLGEIGLGRQETDTQTWRYGGRLEGEGEIGRAHNVHAGLHADQERYDPFNSLAIRPEGSPSRRETVAFWIGDRWTLAGGDVQILPSLRLENVFNHLSGDDPTLSGQAAGFRNSRNDHPVTGRIGVAWQIVDPVVLSANGSRSVRAPTFAELFGDRGLIQGNPTLRPEEGWNWDVGSQVTLGHERTLLASFKASYFENRYADLIQFIQTSQRTARAENLMAALARGVEGDLHLERPPWLDLSVDYTFQRVRNTSGLPGTGGKTLPGRPEHELSLRLASGWRGLRPFTTLHYLDGNFLDAQNLYRVSHRLLWGGGVTLRFLNYFEARLEGKNLLDDPVVDVLGFPLPGRTFYAQISMEV